MRPKKPLKLFLALLIAPLILLAWIMICIGDRKDVNQLLQRHRSTHQEDATPTFHVVTDEAADVAPIQEKS